MNKGNCINKESEIARKTYSNGNDFILEIIEESEEDIFNELLVKIPATYQHLLNKYIEVSNYISSSKIELAYANGFDDGCNHLRSSIASRIEKGDI